MYRKRESARRACLNYKPCAANEGTWFIIAHTRRTYMRTCPFRSRPRRKLMKNVRCVRNNCSDAPPLDWGPQAARAKVIYDPACCLCICDKLLALCQRTHVSCALRAYRNWSISFISVALIVSYSQSRQHRNGSAIAHQLMQCNVVCAQLSPRSRNNCPRGLARWCL